MASQVLQNFRYGLDLRRSEQTSQVGVLSQLIDAHINEGAEIEKRFPFAPVAALGTNAYGIEATATGLAFFGYANGVGNITGPGGTITYQRLTPYSLSADAGVVMTKVLFSGSFNGKAFAYATFQPTFVNSPSYNALYYDGAIVAPSVNGLVTAGMTLLVTTLYNSTFVPAMPAGWTCSEVTVNPSQLTVTINLPTGVKLGTVAVSTTGVTGTGLSVNTATAGASSFTLNLFLDVNQISPVWGYNSTWTVIVTDSNNNVYTLGAGNLSLFNGFCAYALGNRVYLGGTTSSGQGAFAFCALNDPTRWEQQDTGAGVVGLQGPLDTTVRALAAFQGRLAVFMRYSVQLWQTDANPANFTFEQQLDNIGTAGALSAQSLGDLDVVFLDESGFRSLRAQVASLNALSNDIGSPVNDDVRQALVGQNPLTLISASVSGIEPRFKRYLCYFNGVIYVLSAFPATKVLAWSKYTTTFLINHPPFAGFNGGNYGVNGYLTTNVMAPGVYYFIPGAKETGRIDVNGVQVTNGAGYFFVPPGGLQVKVYGTVNQVYTGSIWPILPEVGGVYAVGKFAVYNGKIYVLFQFSPVGANPPYNSYVCVLNDASIPLVTLALGNFQAVIQIPWLDQKRPSDNKLGTGIDIIAQGAWKVQAAFDYNDFNQNPQNMPTIWNNVGSSTDKGRQSFTDQGSHFSAYLTSQDGDDATLSALVLLYNQGSEK